MDYSQLILQLLKKDEALATSAIMKHLRKKTKKQTNWVTTYRHLEKLEEQGKIRRIKVGKIIAWLLV